MSSEVRIENGRTRYNDQGSRPAHITRSEALMKANEAMVSLKGEADEWLSADMTKLAGQVAGMEQGPLEHPKVLDPMYRTVCSIRDTSGHFGNNGLCVLADGFCELITRMTESGRCHVDALNTHLSALKLVYRTGENGLPENSIAELTANLKSLIDMYPPEGVAKAGGAKA
jgi:hypothetical protein